MTAPARPTPLWAVLTVTFINSVGTGVANNGIYFLTKSAYGFKEVENYAFALLLGVTYIAGALGVGPALTRLAAKSERINTRMVLAGVAAAMGASCLLPLVARGLSDSPTGGSWGVWAMIAIYSPVSGALWPITEGYVSGGRSGSHLRAAIGRFNVTWSAALVVCFWAVAPLVKDAPLTVIAGLGVLHAATILLLPAFGADPGEHAAERHEPHPPVYHRLLAVHRILLPASYVVLAAFTPYLPTLLSDRLGIAIAWLTPAASVWLLGRAGTFVLFERWHGWHGKWWTPIAGASLLLSGFALAVVAPGVLAGTVALAASLAGLAAFGIGMAVIYTAALYYAMEVGRAEVDAGGVHESLIGVGYTLGPLCGLAAGGLVSAGAIDAAWYGEGVLALVAVIALAATATALRTGLRPGRGAPSGSD